jgi:hypothetical protein
MGFRGLARSPRGGPAGHRSTLRGWPPPTPRCRVPNGWPMADRLLPRRPGARVEKGRLRPRAPECGGCRWRRGSVPVRRRCRCRILDAARPEFLDQRLQAFGGRGLDRALGILYGHGSAFSRQIHHLVVGLKQRRVCGRGERDLGPDHRSRRGRGSCENDGNGSRRLGPEPDACSGNGRLTHQSRGTGLTGTRERHMAPPASAGDGVYRLCFRDQSLRRR